MKKESQNILIWGGGFVNKGAEAMIRTVQHELTSRLPGVRFTAEAISDEFDTVQALGMEPFPRGDQIWRERWEKWQFRWKQMRHMKPLLKDIDALVDISGYAFGGRGCNRQAYRLYAPSKVLRKASARVIIMPQAWGPFPSPKDAAAVSKLLAQTDLVHTRDNESHELLMALPGIQTEKIRRAPDTAFLFQPSDAETGMQMVRQSGIEDTSRPLIAIAPNMRLYDKTEGDGDDNVYLKTLIEAMKVCLDEFDADLLLVPHEIRPEDDSHPDDRFLCRLLKENLPSYGNRIGVIDGRPGAPELKAAIGQTSFVLGSRFHSLIAALSQCIPAVAIGWSHKYGGLFDDVGLGDYAMQFLERHKSDDVLELLRRAWNDRDAMRDTLDRTIPVIKSEARTVFDEVAKVLEDQRVR